MSEVLLCSRPYSPSSLLLECGISSAQVCRREPATVPIWPYQPYLLGQTHPHPMDQAMISPLQRASHAERKNLLELTQHFGANRMIALAGITSALVTEGMDGTTDVYVQRMQGFRQSVDKYQEALLKYREALQAKTPGQEAKAAAQEAFNQMNRRFRIELSTLHHPRSPITNLNRGLNIARSSRSVVKLQVTDQLQASSLVKFGRYARFLGNGITAIDFTSRIGNVRNEYKAGGDWNRELFIESSSFALSTGSGLLVAKGGAALLTLLVVATPIGWVGLIVAGVAVAGVAAGVSVGANYWLKDSGAANRLYDKIRNQ